MKKFFANVWKGIVSIFKSPEVNAIESLLEANPELLLTVLKLAGFTNPALLTALNTGTVAALLKAAGWDGTVKGLFSLVEDFKSKIKTVETASADSAKPTNSEATPTIAPAVLVPAVENTPTAPASPAAAPAQNVEVK